MRDPTDETVDNDARHLTALADRFPGVQFERYSAGMAMKWSAQALGLDARPWCIITSDPAEFPAHLATAQEGQGE